AHNFFPSILTSFSSIFSMSNPNERYTKLVIWLVFIVCLASNVLAILAVAIAKHENIIDQSQLDRSLLLLLAFMIIQFIGFFSLHFDYSFHYTLATFVLCATVQITLIVMSAWHHFLILAAI